MNMDVLLPIGTVLFVYLLRTIEVRTKRDTVRGPVKENLTFRLFILAGAGMLVSSIIEFLLSYSKLWWPSYLAGCLVAIASFTLRRRAIRALGKFWSLHVEIRENHQFVRSGPFRWMRHPTYFSMILELLCVGLLLNARYSFLVAALFFIPTLFMRLKMEERALIEKFGAAYLAYQQETPALIPYKWPATR